VRARTPLNTLKAGRENMSELKANNYSLVDELVKPASLEPVIEKVWQKLD
jgi:hypothetical protein